MVSGLEKVSFCLDKIMITHIKVKPRGESDSNTVFYVNSADKIIAFLVLERYKASDKRF